MPAHPVAVVSAAQPLTNRDAPAATFCVRVGASTRPTMVLLPLASGPAVQLAPAGTVCAATGARLPSAALTAATLARSVNRTFLMSTLVGPLPIVASPVAH